MNWEELADKLFLIEDEFRNQGYKVTLEGGGAAYPFFEITMSNGNIILFGNCNDVWSGNLFLNSEALEYCDAEEDTPNMTLLRDVYDPVTIVRAFIDTFGR